MKKLDIKSFLIGVLVTTNIFFFMGFSSSNNSSDIKSVMRDLDRVLIKVSDIEYELRKTSESKFGTVRYMLRRIYSGVGTLEDRLKKIERSLR